MITEHQRDLINKLILVGYGWGKYAQSVLNSGNCSEKQHETLLKMVGLVQYKNTNKHKGSDGTDWDDRGEFYE